ncbi:MAG TPA: hypothetical protein VII74_04665 [Chthoniobacterales bacterium]
MKLLTRILPLLALLPLAALQAQQPATGSKAAMAPKRTDVYHVFIVKAALGKAKELQAWLKQPDPDHPDAKAIVLRHEDGDSWDFVAVEYLGATATVDLHGTPMTPQQRLLTEWHNDTFVAGPSWSDFSKALGLDDASKSSGSVYVISDYRAAPGHRDELEKMLSEATPGDTASGNVLLSHLEGAPWNFLGIVRYDSWEKYAEGEKSSVAQLSKGQGGWFELRQHCALHHDTLTDRVAP